MSTSKKRSAEKSVEKPAEEVVVEATPVDVGQEYASRQSHRPEVVAVTLREGGEWVDWVVNKTALNQGGLVHSLKFEDGSIWDVYGGWRS